VKNHGFGEAELSGKGRRISRGFGAGAGVFGHDSLAQVIEREILAQSLLGNRCGVYLAVILHDLIN
jgi:hypothetical protein